MKKPISHIPPKLRRDKLCDYYMKPTCPLLFSRSRMKRFTVGITALISVVFLSGCTSYVKKSTTFDSNISRTKVIAVMPADIEVYQFSAGGIRELMDEWSDQAKELVRQALEKHFASRYGFEIKFIDEKWLKENDKELWETNRGLYTAVAVSALLHAYPGPNTFPDKIKNFDYTLGEEIQALAKLCGADALLFIHGFDHEATAGRVALFWWNVLMGVATGVTILPTNPSFMAMGLADGTTGEVEWFKINPPETEYSFRNQNHMDSLIEWMTRDFLRKK